MSGKRNIVDPVCETGVKHIHNPKDGPQWNVTRLTLMLSTGVSSDGQYVFVPAAQREL